MLGVAVVVRKKKNNNNNKKKFKDFKENEFSSSILSWNFFC